MSAPAQTTPAATRTPAELIALPQWVCWRYEERNGKTTKAPINAKSNGRLIHAKSNDPATWASHAEAMAACERHPELAGVGFCFAPDDGLTGIDLDHVIDPETGELKPEAAEILERFHGTYAEVSPSGTGLRLFAFGKPGRSGKNTGMEKWLEVYSHPSSRYLTVTGDHWTDSATAVTEQQAALDWLHARFMTASTGGGRQVSKQPVDAKSRPSVELKSDERLLKKARSAKNGGDFERLWAGDTSGHGGDESAADLALCNMLAFWTQGNPDTIDRLFRQSGLMRDKWDSKRGESGTYGQITTDKAIARCKAFYGDRISGRCKSSSQASGTDGAEASLKYKNGEVVASYLNAVRLLQSSGFGDGIAFNLFAGRLQRISAMPWDSGTGDWTDNDSNELLFWAAENHDVDFSADAMERAIALVGRRNAFNPAQDRLKALAAQWDKKSRLSTWLADYLSVESNELNRAYLAEIGAAWLKGVTARVLFPGCKMDDVLVQVGVQGFGKSTAAAAIADAICQNSFTDSLGNLGTDEAANGIRGITIAEFSELSAVARSELEATKAFVSRASDRFREKYARHPTDHPRTCSFIATTNEDCGFLRDPSGNRRWWPVTVAKPIDSERLKAMLPALLGEAASRVLAGEAWHVTDSVALKQADEIREDNSDRDVWEAAVIAAMEILLPHERTIAKVLDFIGVKVDRQDRQATNRVSTILRMNGWKRKRARISNCGRCYVWELSPSMEQGGHKGDTTLASQQAACPYVPICPPQEKNNFEVDSDNMSGCDGNAPAHVLGKFNGNQGGQGGQGGQTKIANSGETKEEQQVTKTPHGGGPVPLKGDIKGDIATRDNPQPPTKPLSPLDGDIVRYLENVTGTATEDEVHRQTSHGQQGRTLPLVRVALHKLVAAGVVDKVNGQYRLAGARS